MANSRRATRPSLFRPTSMTALSFSMAVTVPLTTRPSKPPLAAPPSVSSRRAAKSSRVGLAEVAMLVSLPMFPAKRFCPPVFPPPRHHCRKRAKKGRTTRQAECRGGYPAAEFGLQDRRRLGAGRRKRKENGVKRTPRSTVSSTGRHLRHRLAQTEREGGMSGWWDRKVVPDIFRLGCGCQKLAELRQPIVSQASGEVLELGIGAGANLRWYDTARVESLTRIEPSPELRAMATAARRPENPELEVIDAGAEALPFADASFDSVVCTFTLCTVHDHHQAVREARRVLRPGGRLLFCEHGLA